MSTEIAVRQLDNEQVKFIANTNFVPAHYRGKLPEIMACLATGRELGIGDMEALRLIHVIDGKPTMAAQLMVKLARQAGHSIQFEQGDGFAKCIATRGDNGDSMTVTWTLEMANRAGLLNKDNYKKHPETMLVWRAASQACRFMFPDVLGGVVYTPDEAEMSDEDRVVEKLAGLKPPADAGPDDSDDPPVEDAVLDYSATVIPRGAYEGKTLAEVLQDVDGEAWVRARLKTLAPDDSLREALEGFAKAELPDAWAAYEAWRAAQ